MAKQQQAMITAQHVSRTDKDGNPQVKEFTRKAWDNIPMRHYSSREVGIVKQTKNGWVQVGETTGKKAPAPLKKAEPAPVAAPRPAPQAPRPTAYQKPEEV